MNINVMFRSIFCMRLFLKTIYFFSAVWAICLAIKEHGVWKAESLLGV